jgi:hypothetical protein
LVACRGCRPSNLGGPPDGHHAARRESESRITIFEYISVAIAIVISFGVVRLLDGVSHAVDRNGRYWPHLAWVGIKFLQCFNAWWMLWASRSVSWDYGRFLMQLAPPLILYLQATALVTSSPRSVEDWRAHYYAARRRFFGLNFFLGFSFYFANRVAAGWEAGPTAPVVPVVVAAASIVGFVSDSHRLHSTLALIMVAGNILLVAAIYSIPNPG